MAFAAAHGLVALPETGDKTPLATVSLGPRNPWPPVFAGASAALVRVAAACVLIGAQLSRRVSRERIEMVASILFVAAGALLILEAPPGG